MPRPSATAARIAAAAAVAVTTLYAGAGAANAASPQVASPYAASPHAASGQHGIGIRLLDAAVSRRDDPRAHIYIDDHVAPGSSITRHVQVTDFTSAPVHLLTYAVSSSIGATGWDVASGRAANELTSWMHVTPSTLDLQPGKSATVTVQIAVPTDASRGERYATVVAELPAPKPTAAQPVPVATRVGVRVYLDVGAGGEPASNFTISTLTPGRADDGTPYVAAQVTNTGGRALDLGGRLTLSDGPGGLRAGPYDVQVPRTLGIGQTGDVTVPLDKQTPAGPWLARLTLQSGFVSHTVTGRLTFPTKAGAVAPPVPAKPVPLTRNRHVLVPVALGLISLVLLALAAMWWNNRWRRRRLTQAAARGPAPDLPSPRRAADDLSERRRL